MTGIKAVNMPELVGIASRCREAVITQHPELEAIAEKFENGETEALFQTCNGDLALWHERLTEWLDAQQEVPGDLLTLIPMADFERDPRSIMEQAIEAAGPNVDKLWVARSDDDGHITFPLS